MRQIRIFEHVSIDGVIQHGEDDAGDFPYRDWTTPYRTPAGARAVADAQGERFDLLLGRRTYDMWSRFWSKITTGPFADKMNAATKYVATHRADGLEWGPVETVGADVVEGVRRVKSQDGPDLIVSGSSTLTSVLLDHGLVDDLVLMVYPVLLGRGKRLLSDRGDARELALVSTQTTGTGVLINTYRHAGSLRAAPRRT